MTGRWIAAGWLVITQIVTVLLIWAFAIMSRCALGTEGGASRQAVIEIVLFPLFCVACAAFSWVLLRRGKIGWALLVTILPLVPLLLPVLSAPKP